jgi:hypothetical protein
VGALAVVVVDLEASAAVGLAAAGLGGVGRGSCFPTHVASRRGDLRHGWGTQNLW